MGILLNWESETMGSLPKESEEIKNNTSFLAKHSTELKVTSNHGR